MNFAIGAAGIPAPIDFAISGYAIAAVYAAAFLPFIIALRRRTRSAPAAVVAGPEPDFAGFDVPQQRAA